MSGIPPTTEGTVLQDIITECIEDSEIWFPETANDVPFMMLALCGETGEAANELKKVLRRGPHDYPDPCELGAFKEELVDVFTYLMNIIGMLNIDIVKAYNEKRAANEKRFYS